MQNRDGGGATQPHERERSRKIGSLGALAPFFRPYRAWVSAAFVALFITAGLSLSLPMAVRRVIDSFSEGDASYLDQYFGAAVLIVALLALGTGLRYYLVTQIGERVVTDIRKDVYDKMIVMSPAFFERVMTGEVLSRITTDTTLILSLIGSSISIAMRNAVILVGGLVFMLFTSAKLTGLVLLVVPLVVLPILILGRRLRGLSRDNQDKIAQSSGNASETLLSAQTIQAFGFERRAQQRFSALSEEAYSTARTRITTRAIMTVIVIFLIFTSVVGVLWIGAHDVRAGVMSSGVLVQFVIYAVMVAGAVGALSDIWGELQRAAGATERLVELLHAQDLVEDPAEPLALPAAGRLSGAVTFDAVEFRYPSRPDMPALSGFSLAIKPGETVALVGPSGAGKTTVFQLLLRHFDPLSGEIRLDDLPTHQITRADLRSQLALVPQDPVIFATTAYENIRFGRPEASEAEIIAAARAAHADGFLEALPEGYHTQVGERGVMLSGGQKQRIAIARAILRAAPVLLLDEATSALDAQSERAVQQAVDALSGQRTMLIIAHRLATVKRADRIIVMDQGRIVDEGTHEALVARSGLYADLAKLQFESER